MVSNDPTARHAPGDALPVGDPQPPRETSDGSTPEAASTVGHELRLAIVMYGGVSLAIYINGVAQELLHLVRATAAGGAGTGIDDPGATLGPDAEAALAQIYREAAQHLGAARGEADAALPTRVVIDIASGASAGGINGIFLAKALAAGTPMPALKDFWVAEADAAKLVADDHSRTHLLARDTLPSSLFNGDRMFEKLLREFSSVPAMGAEPRAHELDLFVALTDLQGFNVPLRLFEVDRHVNERRHRTGIHFRVDREHGRDDFAPAYDPLLAFAARSTSSIPFVFTPSQLGAGATLAERVAGTAPGSLDNDLMKWSRFFPAYRSLGPRQAPADGESAAPEHVRRRFVDGGVLNNKPFDYAVGSLVSRRGATSVTRKLLYVEPSPDHLGADDRAAMRSDPFTVGLASAALPWHETIRDDVETILERNRQIDRVRTLTMGAAEDREAADDERSGLSVPIRRDTFERSYLTDLIRVTGLGIAYGGHHRLKVANVTDDVARILGELSGIGENDDQIAHLRDTVVKPWRERTYAREKSKRDGVRLEPETAFLLRFDLAYRLRRLHFVLERVDEWLACRAQLAKALEAGTDPEDARTVSLLKTLRRVANAVGVPNVGAALFREATFEHSLRDLRVGVGAILSRLQGRVAALHNQSEAPPLADEAPPVDEQDAMKKLLKELQRAARDTVERWENADSAGAPAADPFAFTAFAARLHGLIEAVTGEASTASKVLFEPIGTADSPDTSSGDPADRVARAIVADAYWDFERFDMVRFPVMTLAGLGDELAPVELHRISPRDATSVVNEATSGHRKLAGTAFLNFGAFFDARWRDTDITWGRLDAAELLIGAMVTSGEVRDDLIARAHAAICAIEGTTVEGMKAGVEKRPELDRNAANAIAGRSARVLGRLFGELRRDRPDVPLLGVARTMVTNLGRLWGWLVAVVGSTNAFVGTAATIASVVLGVVFGVLLVRGLVEGRTDMLFVGIGLLAIVWLWDVMTWGYRSFVDRLPFPLLALTGLGLLKVVTSVVVGAVGLVAIVELGASTDEALGHGIRGVVSHVLADQRTVDAFLTSLALIGVGVVLACGRAVVQAWMARHAAKRGVEPGGGVAGRWGRAVRKVVAWLVVGAYAGAVVMFSMAA